MSVWPAGSVTWAQLDRLIEEARILAADPDDADTELSSDTRRVDIDKRNVSVRGTVRIEGELALTDASDLDTALTGIADDLAACGSTDSLDVRRSVALGELARRQPALPLDTPEPVSTPEPAECMPEPAAAPGPTVAGEPAVVGGAPLALRRRPRRDVQLHVHISIEQLFGGCACAGRFGRVDAPNPTPVDVDAIRAWCGNPDARVTVRPILDLADHIQVDGYQAPDRLREQIVAISPTCVFPHCNRPARGCDLDHIEPYQQGGPTSSDNLAPLCRRHHRLKTHSGWTYQRITAGVFLWTSPAGGIHLRDGTGTHDLTPPGPPGEGGHGETKQPPGKPPPNPPSPP